MALDPTRTTHQRVIVLEFNELTPSLVDRFMDEGRLRNFERLRGQASVFRTDAGEKAPNLEPWIQWVTAHTGMPFEDHRVFRLNEGHRLEAPRVWDYVSDAGSPVLVVGSMNARPRSGLRGVFLPDPWSDPDLAQPPELAAYARFVGAYVQEHTNDRVPLRASDRARFVTLLARRGLSRTTVGAAVRQLADEILARRRQLDRRWQRVALMDLFEFDIFRWYFRRLQPRLSTFFLNSTAHLQHKFWWHHEPAAFPQPPAAPESRSYGDAIAFGYEAMDRLLGRFLRLDPGATLVFCTALSQQPSLQYAATGGKVAYRPSRFEALFAAAEIANASSFSPVMNEEFYAHFADESTALAAAERLRQLKVDGREVMAIRHEGASLYLGCAIYGELAPGVQMDTPRGPVSFFDVFYCIDERTSGRHHPVGMLWIKTPGGSHSEAEDLVPLTRVAPTILELCGIDRPSWMEQPLPVAPSGAPRPVS